MRLTTYVLVFVNCLEEALAKTKTNNYTMHCRDPTRFVTPLESTVREMNVNALRQ